MNAKNHIVISAVVGIFLFSACNNKSQKTAAPASIDSTLNTLTVQEKSEGWKLLFDGTTLNGWRNFNHDSLVGWKVDSGNLVALGEGGDHNNDIITRDTFENFELSLEWKISSQGNSGVFFNAVEGNGIKAIYEIAPEYQLIDELGWDGKLEEWQKAGAAYAMVNVSGKKNLKPVGEFNLTRIIVNKGRVEHYLNGEKLLEYQLWTPEWEKLKKTGKWKDYPQYGSAHKGHIGLQDHGKQTFFRNIKIRML